MTSESVEITLCCEQMSQVCFGVNFSANGALKLMKQKHHLLVPGMLWLLRCYLSGMLIDKTWLEPLGIMTV